MKLENIAFDDFLKNFYNYPELKGFVLRIRDSKDKDKGDSNSNIAYYEGLKAFDIIKTDDGKVQLKFPTNVYKCNTTDVRKIKKEKSSEKIKEYNY